MTGAGAYSAFSFRVGFQKKRKTHREGVLLVNYLDLQGASMDVEFC